MKTIKLVMIATFASFAMVAFANPVETLSSNFIVENPPLAKASSNEKFEHVYITTDQALNVPFLLDMILDRQPRNFLNGDQEFYTMKIRYMNVMFHIIGSYNDWLKLLNNNGVIITEVKQKSTR